MEGILVGREWSLRFGVWGLEFAVHRASSEFGVPGSGPANRKSLVLVLVLVHRSPFTVHRAPGAAPST
jgi:hypothetical protein